VQKGTIRCRSLVPDLRGLGGLGGRNMYNLVGVIVCVPKIISPGGRDGATGIGLGYQYDYGARNGFHMAVKGRLC